MPPHSEVVPHSSLGIVPPASRTRKAHALTVEVWLEEKKDTDGAEGLWRVDDGIYDLTDFIDSHPGGADWISLTKGTDITEAFEVHHLTTLPEEMLKKYFVKKASAKRNAPFTFKEDGFYRTLKREIQKVIKTVPKQSSNTSNFLIDALTFFLFFFSTLSVTYMSYGLGLVSGLFLGMVTIAAHNYIHRKDNWRMYLWQFSLMQVREFRISHVFSHHLHTNTIDDLEISLLEPLLQYMPIEKKPAIRWGQICYAPFIWISFFHGNVLRRLMEAMHCGGRNLRITDLTGLTLPLAMYILSGRSLLDVLWMWNFILLVGSVHYGFVGLHAAHHHPDIFHDGDTPRSTEDYDWGLSQLDAVMDRKEISGSHFLVLTNFGDHCLHHMFPTLDHGTLEHLYPVFKEVLGRFGAELRMVSQWDTITGGSSNWLFAARPPLHSTHIWLEGKRADDGAEGLWRIHDNLYDFSSFVDSHPGGKDWLKLTKGTDITEAFESHHISDVPERLIHNFFKRTTDIPRNSPFTFNENEFYKVLKKRIFCFFPTFASAFLSVHLRSFILGAAAGIFLSLTAVAAHNFFHQRDNFRIDWRISHVLSHHSYTNTVNDLEISSLEPFLQYLPTNKHFIIRYVSWLYSPIVYAFIFFASPGKCFYPLPFPFFMFLTTGESLGYCFLMFLWTTVVSSTYFGIVGLNAAHHHPDIFHDGDSPRPENEMDWGVYQLDAVMDRKDITGSHFLVLTNFGDHGLHHMFPTIDHGLLEYLYPVFLKTCKEFGLEWKLSSQLGLVKGQYRQLAKNKPKSAPQRR
ncbi:hypothetical protein NQ317_013425 [Molorchus minor]|uniref:Cytochrome b5 heme-binding domain-containing protein n=1 Tax=Molorchus minor TaxID=1323400 RepID=A0ABQ9JRU0_9CUCU|nr:hypothetical protein NQ317_013425 [Molorchus minor]